MKKINISDNYYKILEELKEIEIDLHSFKNPEELTKKIIKTKSYIYSKELLKNEFNNNVKKFYNNFNTPEYTENACKSREQVKNITVNLMKNEGEIAFLEISNPTTKIKDWTSSITSNKQLECKFTADNTKLYYYPSIMLLDSKFIDTFGRKGVQELKEMPSLECFYNTILYKYGYTAETIKVPKYIEFYLSTTEVDFIKGLGKPDFFSAFYYLTCLNSVLGSLHTFIECKIYDEYHKNMLIFQDNKRKLKNNRIKIKITDNKILICEKDDVITLTPELYQIFAEIWQSRHKKDKNTACNVSRINKNFKNLQLPPIIIKKYRKSPYIINENEYDIK